MSRTQRDANSLRNSGSHAFPDIPQKPESVPRGTANDCFEAMRRHHERQRQGVSACSIPAEPVSPVPNADGAGRKNQAGDIIYGADAIARFVFADYGEFGARKARRRVYHLWNHYRDRREPAGFLKLNGALCLSRSQWRRFHGLD